ncbi:peptidase [Gardnerella vaginalis]|uniref:Rib/alpha-like domain-containing protein n=1 Tax=Gardnerella vaginalis TaxID=2702 RepID=UPI001574837C|nr:Rib/alpha-like domain-containing protein [Gardnerella vaginalis]NSX27013.1 peptidase [Gardnerella vaginalis]
MANNNRKKHAREQVESSFKNVDSSSAYATMRKVSLSTLATVLTAATCLGGQPILASSNILLPPTTAAFAQEVRNADTTPWLHTPNILEFQRYRFANSNGTIGQIGSDGLGDYSNTTKKSDMYAHLEENNGAKYLVFDVFFNNDGKDMTGASKQQQYVWQIPFAVADLNNGYYNGDTLSDLSFNFYKRNSTSPQTKNAVLSRDFSLFTKEDSQSATLSKPLQDDQHLGNSIYKITLGIRGGNSNKQDLSDTFHKNAGDGVISNATTLRGVYSGKSYGIGLRTTNVDFAVHMHCKVKLRQGVTLEDIQDAYTWANTSTYGRTTNSAYTFISGRERWSEPNLKRTKSDKIPPKLYLNGKEISDSNNSITVYQGDIPTITFSTSDDSGKVNSFSVKGLPNGNGDVTENSNGMEATEAKHHNHVVNRVKFEYKNGNTPANTDYTVTVSATDASENKVEKKVTVHLKNLNQKYKAPTTTPITVDWGHKATNEELKKHVSNIEGGGQLDFNTFPETKLPDIAFNGKDTATTSTSAKVIYSDNSYHIVTIPVIVRKPLALQHKSELKDHEVKVNVGDTLTKTGNKVDAKEYLGITDKKVKDNIKSAEWVNGEPSTAVAGKREYTAKVTFSDGSTAEEKVTFTVRPKKPTIETDLTGVAGVQGKEVVVDAGPGTAGSTVTLKDSKGNQIETGKVGNDGKVTITVANGIPEGNITAVTTTADSVSSDASDAKKATKDDKAPTLTADKDSVTVKVGEDLKIQLTAKDDVKIESINAATATMAFARNDLSKMMVVAARAKTDYTTNTDKEKVFTYTFSGFKPEEVGTYTLTFSATDAAGHKTEKTVTVKVEKKEDIKPRNITVDLGHKLDEKDAKKAIANHRSLPKGTKFAWSKETNGTPDTSTVGKEKSGKVIVTIPTNDKNHPRVETVDVKVTVRDNESPKVAIQQKGDGGTYNTINGTHLSGPKDAPVFIINTYRGDKNDIKITATDNSGEVTTLTLTPKTPGETEKAPTGTGTTADPKTLTLDGTTPLNTKPGEYTRTITAVDPSGNTNKVTVKFIVKPQSDKYSKVTGTPVTYNMSDGTKHPDPKSGIDLEAVKKLPKDAKYSWAKEPDWNKPGKDTTATVRITFPDGSTKDVETKVTVKDNIAPVIENPATNQVKHDDKQMYYQFKVHKDKPFDIEIKSYDNSGKISSATISTFPGYDGKITVDNQNGNSAEKPATIHIKGTGKRDPKLTNSSDNKWSRDLIVKDEAGNTSKLKVQISVYTDAEEHNAAPNATPKNPDQNAITNAIIITKKDDPKKTPIDKKDLTFTVGNIPQDDGVHTVPVTITYPDHSTTIVNVPVLIHKDAKDYDPKGQTVEVPWNTKPEELTKKITSFDNGGGLTWNGTSGKDKLKSVEIVNTKDVPSTDKPGESQVQVKVTYKDGSSDVATVTVRVLKPQSETYKPEGQTINIDYNKTPNAGISSKITGVGKDKGISFGKDKQGKDITLPEGASIAIDDKAKTVPDGTQPGTFDIPVTITYKDGSKDHATVKVTVGKPQSETHTPKVDGGITKKYGESGPSDNDIITKVTVPNQPTGTTITVDKGQTPIDTKTPGTVNVKVTVKYPDGSEDHVEVPVTVGNPDNETYKPGAEAINKKRNDPAPTAEDIKNAVKTSTVKDKPAPKETKVELVDPKTPLPTTDKTGTTNVPVKVTYPDGSSTVVQVPVVVTDTDATANTPAVDPVEEPYGTDKEKTKKAVTAAVTVPDFKPKKDGDKPTVTITSADKDIPDGTKPGTYHVKVKVTYPDNTTDEVTVDVTIKNKQSDTFEPKVTPVVKPFGKQVTSDDVTKNVTVPDWSKDSKEQPKIELNEPNQTLPDGQTPGNSTVKVKVTYPDGTTDTVDVPVTISNKQSELYPPKVDNLEKDNGQKPSNDEIIGKVSVPTWPTNETNKPTYSIAEGDKSKIPNGDKAGKFEVPVTVTYPDGSTTVINVPVTIKSPTATAKVVTVPKGVEPKPEDSIANKDKFPDGTKFEWDNNGKPDTSKEGNSVKGKVKITIPGSDTPQEVEVTVNVVDPSASEVNVPQGKDLPEAKDVIKDSHDTSKFPNGTTFEWKPEDKPDTNNPGAKNGKIIVTLPGQSPVDVPVTVNVNPVPIAKETTVPQNSNPDPKNSIDNSTKLPKGTTFEWKKDAAPKTDKPGTASGTVIVKIPGQAPQEVPVTITVTPEPVANDVTVLQKKNGDTTDTTPKPEDVIKNHKDLPKDASISWKKKPDTSKTGNQPGIVTVTVPGEPDVDISVNVFVVPNPAGKTVSVHVGDSPSAENSIANKDELPNGTKFAWATNGTPDTKTAGNNKSGTVVVTIPSIANPVNVPVTVNVVAQNKPVINDGKAENKPGDKGSADNGKTTITGKGTPEATIKVQNSNGTALTDGDKEITVTVDKDGSFTVDVPHQTPGTTLKLVPNKGGVDGDATTVIVTAKPQKPTITVPTDNQKNDGNVTVTPPTDDTTVVKIEINAKPNSINGPEQPVRTIIAKKDNNGKWKIDGDAPDGVTVDPQTGVVTIPAKNLEDGSTITAVSKNKTDKPSDPATAVTGFKTPQISEQTLKDNPDDSTKQIITGKTLPGATVTVTDNNGNQIGTGTADKDGNFTITIDKQKPGAIVTLTPTNGKGDGAKTGDSVNITVNGNITKPKIDTPAEGGASVTPDLTDTRVNKVVVTYTPEGSETTATITVVAEGDKHEWKIDGDAPEGVTVNPQTGVVTIPANKIKHGSTITAQSEDSSDKTGKSKSEVVTAKVGEKEKPAPEPTPTPAGEPTILTPQDGVEQGSATVTPPADADTLEITYIPEGDTTTPVTITVKKDKNGNWTINGNTPTGVTVDPKTGKVTIPATQIKDGSTITAQAKKNGQPSNKVNGKVGNNPTKKPTPTPEPAPAPTPEHESGSHDSDEHTGNSENNRNKSNNTQLQAPKSPAHHSSGQVAQSKLTNTGSAIAAASTVAALAGAIGAALAVIIRRKKRD